MYFWLVLNKDSNITLKLSPKRKHFRVNEPLDVGSPTPFGFNGVLENKNFQSFEKKFIEKNVIGVHIEQIAIEGSK